MPKRVWIVSLNAVPVAVFEDAKHAKKFYGDWLHAEFSGDGWTLTEVSYMAQRSYGDQ